MTLSTFSLIMLAACIAGALLGNRGFKGNNGARAAVLVSLAMALLAGFSSILADGIRPSDYVIAGFWTMFALSTGVFIGQCTKQPDNS
jgi:hypothetical protein